MAKKSQASKLSPDANARRNTKAGRARMAPSSFAIPEEKAYRIDDPAHARNALSRVAQNGTPSEKARVKAAVHRKYPSIGAPAARASRRSR
jgi:hypothetical protein